MPRLNEEGVGDVVPRANAICWDDGETQPTSAALPTLFRNPTMPAIAGQRCWQNLCICEYRHPFGGNCHHSP